MDMLILGTYLLRADFVQVFTPSPDVQPMSSSGSNPHCSTKRPRSQFLWVCHCGGDSRPNPGWQRFAFSCEKVYGGPPAFQDCDDLACFTMCPHSAELLSSHQVFGSEESFLRVPRKRSQAGCLRVYSRWS